MTQQNGFNINLFAPSVTSALGGRPEEYSKAPYTFDLVNLVKDYHSKDQLAACIFLTFTLDTDWFCKEFGFLIKGTRTPASSSVQAHSAATSIKNKHAIPTIVFFDAKKNLTTELSRTCDWVRLCAVPSRGGVHHSKGALLFLRASRDAPVDTLQLVIGTHNLSPQHATDATWSQKFPLKRSVRGGSIPRKDDEDVDPLFEQTLVDLFKCLDDAVAGAYRGLQPPVMNLFKQLTSSNDALIFKHFGLHRFDYSKATVALVTSVPGKHLDDIKHTDPESERENKRPRVKDLSSSPSRNCQRVTAPSNTTRQRTKYGYARLCQVIEHSRVPKWMQGHSSRALIAQPTSIGNLTEATSIGNQARGSYYHGEFLTAIKRANSKRWRNTAGASSSLKDIILWPTMSAMNAVAPTKTPRPSNAKQNNAWAGAINSELPFEAFGQRVALPDKRHVDSDYDSEDDDIKNAIRRQISCGSKGGTAASATNSDCSNVRSDGRNMLFMSAEHFRKLNDDGSLVEDSFHQLQLTHGCDRLVPHIKSYSHVVSDSIGKDVIDWLWLTSACLSRGAHGKVLPIENSTRPGNTKMNTRAAEIILVKNWELGVVFLSSDHVRYEQLPDVGRKHNLEKREDRSGGGVGGSGGESPNSDVRVVQLPVPYVMADASAYCERRLDSDGDMESWWPKNRVPYLHDTKALRHYFSWPWTSKQW